MKLKNLTEILGNLIDRTLVNTRKINDFTFGSVIMSIYESFAMEIEQYYTITRENILWGIEQGIYEAYGFTRHEARRAYGSLTIEFNTALTQTLYIPRGSVFYPSGEGYRQRYETLKDYRIDQGQSKVDIQVFCTQPGVVGNIPKMTISSMANNITNIKQVYNENAFLTGREKEPIAYVKSRFQEFIDTRGRATNKSMAYAVKQVPDIEGVHIEDLTGYIKVYAHDLNGDLPDGLKTEVEKAIEDYRPAGIPVDVFPVTKKNIDLTVLLEVPLQKQSNMFRLEIQEAIEKYLNRFTASDDLIIADLIQNVMNIDDINIQDMTIQNLTENVVNAQKDLIRAGAIIVKFRGE